MADAEVTQDAALDRVRALAQSWSSLLGEWLLRILDGEHSLEGVRIIAEGWMRPGSEVFCPAAGQAVLDALRGASTEEAADWRSRAEAAETKLAQTCAELEHAKSALAGDHEGIRLWMLDCGNLVAKHRERADRAEAALAAVSERVLTGAESRKTTLTWPESDGAERGEIDVVPLAALRDLLAPRDDRAPGSDTRYVCAVPAAGNPDGICGNPVESEPCPEHRGEWQPE